jgi:hypothetical protein
MSALLGERAFFAWPGGGIERHHQGAGVLVRERAGRTARVEEREAHGLTGGDEALTDLSVRPSGGERLRSEKNLVSPFRRSCVKEFSQ